MNNDQCNDLEESKDVDINLTIPQQRDSSKDDTKQEQDAPNAEVGSENEYEEDGTNKTRDNQEEGDEDNDQDQNYHFYKEYCRLYYANIILTNRLQQLLNEKQDLGYKLNRLESNKRKHEEVLGMPFEIDNEKKKRHRRTATEIARHYKCPIEDCPKSYGSEGSLNQHIKIKHPDYYAEMIQQNNANQSMAELGQIGAIPVGSMAPSGLFSTGHQKHHRIQEEEEYSDSDDQSQDDKSQEA